MVEAYIDKGDLIIKLSFKEEMLCVSKGERRVPVKDIEYAGIEPIPKPLKKTEGFELDKSYLCGNFITVYNGERLKSFYAIWHAKEALVIVYKDGEEKRLLVISLPNQEELLKEIMMLEGKDFPS